MSEAIYRRAAQELFQHTYGRLEDRDRMKAIQLFDRLLKRGRAIHVDDLRCLCGQAGYDEQVADDIGQLYDTLCLIRHELEGPRTIDHWPPEILGQIIGRCEEAGPQEVKQ